MTSSILGTLIAFGIATWFFQTARADQQKPFSWAIVGIVIYFSCALFWTFFITPSIKEAALHSRSGFLIFLVRYAYIMFSMGCVTLFKKLMSKKNIDPS